VLIILALIAVIIILEIKLSDRNDENKSLAAYAAAVPDYRYPESTDVVTLDDAYLGEISIPALPSVPRASYDMDKLTYKDKRFEYKLEDTVTSFTGVDVSYFNGDIDWEAVKADGIDFAMIRVGYRGYSEGVIKEDPEFEDNINGAIEAGLDVGVYFYTQAINEAEALEEAEYVIEKLKPYELTYPVALDVEITSAEDVRANNNSGAMLNTVCEIFCDRIKEEGYRPMVYANKRMAYLKLDMRRICKYDFWYAEYTDGKNPDFAYDYKIWQYGSADDIDGIDGEVGLNIGFVKY
jgi:GH25 family lysozyme M1 (1,4-beta-N-acetylmuramidase)